MKEKFEKVKEFCKEHVVGIVSGVFYGGIMILSLRMVRIYLKNLALQNKLLQKIING